MHGESPRVRVGKTGLVPPHAARYRNFSVLKSQRGRTISGAATATDTDTVTGAATATVTGAAKPEGIYAKPIAPGSSEAGG